ncbi:TPA: anaerobic ribonucleoside-triphosphate reductase activating protein [candidate division WOR-3 bacterium]|uniref:Anaerobic ribonucleoside-triphosphate reductase activating protein n=1 Tax=candidate division WOR-3 bacterium TaxID=2052148 RepID=A0A350HBL3_UNCW3|nr:anaerobic ribonucleoside-triphosphate reductase activating protein [candidate division WOR-3 bacterium]
MKNIRIKGFQGVTLLDYPDKVASTIFLGGCNFKCPFCHNPELIDNRGEDIEEDFLFSELLRRRNFIEGICITGGEPLLFDEVIDFIKALKRETGKLIKIDTNGYNPVLLKKIIELNIVDYIAMDVKTSLKKYYIAAGVNVDEEKIKTSIDSIIASNIDYEFRTTVVPEIVQSEDIREIGSLVNGAKKISLQQFRAQKTYNEEFQKLKPYKPEELKRFRDILSQFVDKIDIRGV